MRLCQNLENGFILCWNKEKFLNIKEVSTKKEMEEIGGYFELENFSRHEYHENAIKLNCGRHCLTYLVEIYEIKKIYLPLFCCNSIQCFKRYFPDVEICFYKINEDFTPIIPENFSSFNDWFYLVNFYGQLSNQFIKSFHKSVPNLILDNAQNFFAMPILDIPTIYTCRKYFGVSDGAYLYCNKKIERVMEQDISYKRMNFVLGRYELSANEFYEEASRNNEFFDNAPLKKMSKLTENLLRGINYEKAKRKRIENFKYLEKNLSKINLLKNLKMGTFAYPLLLKNGAEIRKKLQLEKIYIPTLWPDVLEICDEMSIEYKYAKNILPIPCDQRYGKEEMDFVIKNLIEALI